MQRWLASGHAHHLTLANFNLPTDVALRCALATSPTLLRLHLRLSDSVMSGFVARGATLASLTELDVSRQSKENVAGLVALLAHMKTLAIRTLRSQH